MPDKTGRLTRQEVTFVDQYARTGDPTYAAARAGYRTPQPRGSEALQRPAIQAAVREAQEARLWNDLLPAALHCLDGIMRDPKAPAGARVQASKVVLDRTLGASTGALDGKDPAEMTGDELAAAIAQLDRLKAEAAARAKPVFDQAPAEKDVFD